MPLVNFSNMAVACKVSLSSFLLLEDKCVALSGAAGGENFREKSETEVALGIVSKIPAQSCLLIVLNATESGCEDGADVLLATTVLLNFTLLYVGRREDGFSKVDVRVCDVNVVEEPDVTAGPSQQGLVLASDVRLGLASFFENLLSLGGLTGIGKVSLEGKSLPSIVATAASV